VGLYLCPIIPIPHASNRLPPKEQNIIIHFVSLEVSFLIYIKEQGNPPADNGSMQKGS